MTKAAKIDILLPYWGDFSLLRKTVESVLAQTETDWRLLVIDDAYPSDEAPNYFKQLTDPRVSYYRHEQNIGITKNFNYAMNAAATEHCIILGCDDKLLPNYLEVALRKIGTADFYQPGVEVIDGKDQLYVPTADRIKTMIRPKKAGVYSGEKLAASLVVGNWLYFPSIMWRTEVLRRHGFDTTHDNTQDVIIELDIVIEGGKLYVDDEVTFQYRRFADSWSSRRKSKAGGRFREEAEIYNAYAAKFSAMGWKKAARAARLHLTSRLHRIMTTAQQVMPKR